QQNPGCDDRPQAGSRAQLNSSCRILHTLGEDLRPVAKPSLHADVAEAVDVGSDVQPARNAIGRAARAGELAISCIALVLERQLVGEGVRPQPQGTGAERVTQFDNLEPSAQ